MPATGYSPIVWNITSNPGNQRSVAMSLTGDMLYLANEKNVRIQKVLDHLILFRLLQFRFPAIHCTKPAIHLQTADGKIH
jgi:hypothetical protein